MQKIASSAVKMFKDESGASMIEYSILIGLISAAVVVTVGAVGTWVTGKWTALDAALP